MIDLGINLFQEIAALGGGGGYPITNSLRFNDNDSAYLSRTPSVAGNRKTWTWSGWVKRGNLGTFQDIFTQYSGVVNDTEKFNLRFNTSDKITVDAYNFNFLITTPLFRDSSGWYHIVCVFDTTQATADSRVRLYINGVEITSFDTRNNPTLNTDYGVNMATTHRIGSNSVALSQYLDGYLAEVNFIDGQALTPDSFGEINATTGEWSPIAYSGTYGTNGFYLPFDGNANDDSGNGNNWTENNLASTDYMIDTPTNNFAVLNPLADNFATYSQGNLSIVCGTTGNGWTFSTMALPPTGKWYVEAVWTGTPSDFMGFNSPSLVRVIQTRGQSGQIWADNVLVETVTAWSAGQIVGLQVDCDAGTFQFYRDNVAFGSSHSFTHIDGMSFGAQDGSTAASTSFNMNFGADSSFAGNKTRQGNTDANGIGDFYYEPPAGYLALCTENLPAPAIEQPETQFNVVLDTGANIKATAEALYDSSLIWIKDRANSNNHQLIDTVRGTGVLQSNTTAAETTYSAPSGNSVAWVWKAGGTAVTNTDGTITSQVSANVDAGFSIVSYTATNNSSNVGHGLSQAPELVIFKSRTSASSWPVYTTAVDGTYDYLGLNLTNAKGNSVLTAPSSSVIYVNNTEFAGTNVGSNNYIAYSFHSVDGFSKISSYVGNGSTNGPFVYTGFKPAFVMIKNATTSGTFWVIADSEREPYNTTDSLLFPNASDAESTNVLFSNDFLSNGFKIRNANNSHNTSGNTYIYMAFAEHPFKEALAR